MAVIYGTALADHILGTTFDDVIYGGGGDDVIDARQSGDDYLNGEGDNDTVLGGNGDDHIFGEDGNDILHGGGGNDVVTGGAGNDTIYASYNFDTLNGGDGDDLFVLNTEVEWAPLTGLRGSTGSDAFNGGDGFDTIVFAGAPSHIITPVIDIEYMSGIEMIQNLVPTKDVYILTSGYLDVSDVLLIDIKGIQGGDTTDDWLIGAPTYNAVTGQAGVLVMEGFGGNDILEGTAARDELRGGTGNDELRGGAGNDILTGGTGEDRFVFSLYGGEDTIVDFQNGVDKIMVTSDVLTITLVDDGGQAYLGFADADGYSTAVVLTGIAPSAIDASDFIFA